MRPWTPSAPRLGYLARADVASLPAVTQARLLREYERAQSQHTAGRVRALSAFTAQGAYADDGHGGPHPWLAWQTRVTARAASATIGWMRRLGAHPLVAAALAAGTITESYARKICYWSDLLPSPTGTWPTRTWPTRPRAGRTWISWRRWRRRCSPGSPRPIRTMRMTPGSGTGSSA